MPANVFQQPGQRAVRIGLLALVTGLLSACAPDNFLLERRSSDLDSFLNRISKNCGTLYLNEYQLWQLANNEQAVPEDQEAYFLDQASLLLYGKTTQKQYVTDLSAYFNDDSSRGKAAVQCILAQLPKTPPPTPKLYQEVDVVVPAISGGQ